MMQTALDQTIRISARDIRLGDWTDEDGLTYRAAYVHECVLTGPEHAHLSDVALMQEAIAEAKRAEIWRG